MSGSRRGSAPAGLASGSAGEGDSRAESQPEPGGDCCRGAPQRCVRRPDGHIRGALGNGARADERDADRGPDVDRGRPPRHHARDPQRPSPGQDSARERSRDGGDQGCGRDRSARRLIVSQLDPTREHLIETYRKKAKHYDVTSRLYPAPGYPQRAQRHQAVRALDLRRGDSVVDVACGTGLNFPLLEEVIGPDGWIVGVDLTDAMLARAEERMAANGWSNIRLVQADAAAYEFPSELDGILSTYALSQVPECA